MSELPQAMRNSQLEQEADMFCDRFDEILFEVMNAELARARAIGNTVLVGVGGSVSQELQHDTHADTLDKVS